MKQFEGRVAVVTGAGSGIGRATSQALARRGCHIAVVDIDQAAAEETAALVRALGRRASVHLVDVRDGAAFATLPQAVLDAHGACHILVNNAGVTAAGVFEDESLADLRRIIDTNIWGVLHGCRAFLPILRQSDEAHIVNLSSMVGLLGLPYNTSYVLTKGAVRSFSEALRSELVTTRIGVTAVFPGSMRTNITESAGGTHASLVARLGRSRWAGIVMRPPTSAARKIVKAIERDRARVVVGPDAHVIDLLSRVLPGRSGLVGRLTSRVVRSDRPE